MGDPEPRAQEPGPGWWVAADGNWYPPELHPESGIAVVRSDAGEQADPDSAPTPEPRPAIAAGPPSASMADSDDLFRAAALAAAARAIAAETAVVEPPASERIAEAPSPEESAPSPQESAPSPEEAHAGADGSEAGANGSEAGANGSQAGADGAAAGEHATVEALIAGALDALPDWLERRDQQRMDQQRMDQPFRPHIPGSLSGASPSRPGILVGGSLRYGSRPDSSRPFPHVSLNPGESSEFFAGKSASLKRQVSLRTVMLVVLLVLVAAGALTYLLVR